MLSPALHSLTQRRVYGSGTDCVDVCVCVQIKHLDTADTFGTEKANLRQPAAKQELACVSVCVGVWGLTVKALCLAGE